jgi:hypothetical protein
MFHVACPTWKYIVTFKSFAEGMRGGVVFCPCCAYHLETIDHLFVSCLHMHDFWHSFNTHNTLLPLISIGGYLRIWVFFTEVAMIAVFILVFGNSLGTME